MLLLILTRFVRRYKEFFRKYWSSGYSQLKQRTYLIRLKNFNCTGACSVLLSQHNCKKCLASNLTIHKLLPCETIL